MISFWRSLVRRFPLFLAVAAVCLVLAEILVAVSGRAPKDVYYWRMNPRGMVQRHAIGTAPEISYRTNLQGLRERDIVLPQHDGRMRIIVVGSSQIFGWGVEDHETLTEDIQRSLRANFHTDRIDVINFGVPAGVPTNSMRFIYQYVPHLSPDLVVLAIQKGRDNNTGVQLASDEAILSALEGWVAQSQKPDTNPETQIRTTFWWNSALFRLVFRSRHHIDYRFYGVDWPGFSHTQVDQQHPDATGPAAPFTTETCESEKHTTGLCEPSFESALTDPYAKDLYALLLKTGRIESACACRESPAGLNAAIENAATVPANYEDVLVLRPDTQVQRTRELQLLAKAAAVMRDWVAPADFLTFTYPYGWGILDFDPVDVARDTATIWPRDAILSSHMEDTFRGYCVDERVDCFSITSPLVAFGRGKKPPEVITQDSHFGPATTTIAAHELAEYLRPYVERKLSLEKR